MSAPIHSSLSKCEQCGARASRLEARFCEYCGVELPRPIAPMPPPLSAASSPVERNRARFQALKQHSATSRLKQVTPSGAGQAKHLMPIIGLGVMLVFGILIFSKMNSMGSSGPFASSRGNMPMRINGIPGIPGSAQSSGFSAIPALFIGILVLFGLVALAKFIKFNSAPIIKQPALVVDKRMKVTGGHGDHSASTSYFVKLEFEDGRREEFSAIEDASAQASPQDMGIAYLRDGILVQFGRVPV